MDVIKAQGGTDENDAFVVKGDGQVGIKTTAPNFDQHVDSSAGKPGGGSWSTTSDARLKDIINEYELGLDAINN